MIKMSAVKRRTRNKDPPKYVPFDVCIARMDFLSEQIKTVNKEVGAIKKALVGEDLQSGLVSEIKDIKAKLKMASELRDWVRPIIIAVVASGLTAALIKFLCL